VKVLRSRPTRHFTFLLIRCRCSRRFGHRGDRPLIACFSCGRVGQLAQVWPGDEPPAVRRRATPASRPAARHVLRATLARRRRRAHR
jgi:hypothetical protein